MKNQLSQLKSLLNQFQSPLQALISSSNPKAYTRGLQPYRNKQWQEALAYFQQAAAEAPQHAPSHFKLGMCYFRLKEYEAASTSMAQALELDPSQKQWQTQLDQTARHVVKLSGQTASEKEQAIRDQIERLDNPSAILYNELAHALRKQGKWWQEVEALKSAIAIEDEYPTWHYRLGEALEVMNRFQQAAAAYGRAIELKEGEANAIWYYRQGYCYAREGHDGPANPEAAEAAYQSAIEKDTKLNAQRFGIGVFHQQRGHWRQAQLAYEEQLQVNPEDAEQHYRVGMAHDRCYEWEQAQQCYLKAISLDLERSYWHYRLGFVLERQEKFAEAAAAYQYAAEHTFKHQPYWYYRLGYVLEKQGRYAEATGAYLKTSTSPHGLQKPAHLEDDIYIKELEQRKHEIKRLHEVDVTEPQRWYELGRTEERLGNWRQAAQAYQQAVARQNTHKPELYYRLGYVLAQLENYDSASEALRNSRILQKAYGVSEEPFNKNAGFRQAASYTEYYESLAIQPNTVLYESFHGASVSCNPYAIFLYLLEQPEYKDWTHIWAVNDLNKVPSHIKNNKKIFFIIRNGDSYYRSLASAEYLINNSTFPGYFIRKKGQKYLNTWHGTPWKTLGRDIKNSPFEFANTARNFLQTTHILSPNKHTTHVLINRYDIQDIYRGKVYESGYPRIDLTLNKNEEQKKRLKEKLNISNDKPVVLYAPTWRGSLESVAEEIDKVVDETKYLHEVDANILFRGHYFVESSIYESALSNIVVPDYINTNELLSIVDVLITDYSSIAFDFMATSKPIIYYLNDLEEYKQKRGLYFDADILPGVKVNTIDKLVSQLGKTLNISSLHKKYTRSQVEFTPYEKGDSTKNTVEFFFKEKASEVKVIDYEKKDNVLIFGGEFQPNGITTSLLNLLGNIQRKDLSLTLLLDPKMVISSEEQKEQFDQLPEYVRYAPRVGRMNRTIEEQWIESKMNQQNNLETDAMWSIYSRMFSREFKRMFGDAFFKSSINFTGYSKFWSAFQAFTPPTSTNTKAIYQHNDKFGEWSSRFPSLESVFNLYKKYDKVVSVSEQTMQLNKDRLADLFSIDKAKFIYADNVQNPEEVLKRAEGKINPEDEILFDQASKVFITLGRLSVEKDQEKLIRAFAKVVEFDSKTKLLILGSGPLKQHLMNLIKELRLKDNVYLLGRRLNPFPLLKRSDCFVLSSNHEGQPMVLFEAMIMKKPIISTDIIGSRSAIQGRSGHLVENSIKGLEAAMLAFTQGKLEFLNYDVAEYQNQALDMFYEKVCD